jgi:hypothetical protein
VREGAAKVQGDARRCREGVRCREGARGCRNVLWRFKRAREGAVKGLDAARGCGRAVIS